jgi:hypothetical protein
MKCTPVFGLNATEIIGIDPAEGKDQCFMLLVHIEAGKLRHGDVIDLSKPPEPMRQSLKDTDCVGVLHELKEPH